MIAKRHVAVWLDHHEARIFYVDGENVDEQTLHASSHRVHRNPKRTATEHDHPDDAHHFFRDVARALVGVEQVLVVGPATAKLEFVRYARKHDPTVEARIVGVETVDHPTDRQLVAYSRHYFTSDAGTLGRSQARAARR